VALTRRERPVCDGLITVQRFCLSDPKMETFEKERASKYPARKR
jgi:hypothetical protein